MLTTPYQGDDECNSGCGALGRGDLERDRSGLAREVPKKSCREEKGQLECAILLRENNHAPVKSASRSLGHVTQLVRC